MPFLGAIFHPSKKARRTSIGSGIKKAGVQGIKKAPGGAFPSEGKMFGNGRLKRQPFDQNEMS